MYSLIPKTSAFNIRKIIYQTILRIRSFPPVAQMRYLVPGKSEITVEIQFLYHIRYYLVNSIVVTMLKRIFPYTVDLTPRYQNNLKN